MAHESYGTIGSDRHPRLARLFPGVWHTFRSLFDTYRPERHYMRGRGPAWRAKHPDGSL